MLFKSTIVWFSYLIAVCMSTLIRNGGLSFEKVEKKISLLRLLVNLPENKKTFSSSPYSENAFFDSSTNTLGTLDFVQHHSYQTQPYVANGYFGARIPNLGHGFTYDLLPNASYAQSEELNNGWPLFNRRFAGAFTAGFFNSQENTTGSNFPWIYQYGWDSVISAIPQWTYLSISADGFILDPSRPTELWGNITNYVQTLSLENGVVSTLFTWLEKLHLSYEVSANKHDINLGSVTLAVENLSDEAVVITVTDTIDFRTSQRCRFVSSRNYGQDGVQIIVSPEGVRDVFGAVHSRLYIEGRRPKRCHSLDNNLDVSRVIETVIPPGEKEKFIKLVGIYTTDLSPNIYKIAEDVSMAARETALQGNLYELNLRHNDAWLSALGNSLIEFPDSPLLTMASKASVYHINANMRPGATGLTSALSVSGLSSDSYGGQVFWDTDLWILMGILPFNPSVSKSLLNYRLQSHEQAVKNILSPSSPNKTIGGAIYPWTSGRFGNCTATGPCFDYEYHINADIAYSAIQIYLSGAVDDNYLENTIFPLVFDAALFFSTYLEYDPTILQYVSRNLTDPDEFAEYVDNGAYTNAAISMTIRWATIIAKHLGKTVPDIFTHIYDHIHVPYSPDDSDLVLEYTDMNSSIAVKQADVIMMTYPLENELISEELAIKNLMYYATRQVSTGPAMTFLIFSIVSSAMLDTGCSSESYLLKSIEPFLRGPFAQFLEQSNDHYLTNGGTHPAFPFLTAHGGFLQTILMGLLGMRFSYELEGDRIQRVLLFKAKNLSLFPNGVNFGEVKYMNTSLSINLKNSFLTVKNNGPTADKMSLDTNIKIVSNSVPGVTELRILKKFETANFKVSSRKKSDTNSVTECGAALFINLSAGAQGDVVDLLHDGDNSTYWQAASDGEAQVLIDLKTRKNLKGGVINWGDSPALKIQIYAHHIDDEQRKALKNILPQKAVDQGSAPIQKILDAQNWNFREVFSNVVQINEPFDPEEYLKVHTVKRFNTTKIEFSAPVDCSLIMVKFSGSQSYQNNGAKVFDMSFYEA